MRVLWQAVKPATCMNPERFSSPAVGATVTLAATLHNGLVAIGVIGIPSDSGSEDSRFES